MATPREYETIYILGSDVDDAEKARVSDRIDTVLARFGGEVKRRDEWGRRKLAYKIGVHREVKEAACLTCHVKEHSPKFTFDSYLPRVVGPGHGR